MIQKLFWGVLILLIGVVIGVMVQVHPRGADAVPVTSSQHAGPTIEQIQSLSELASLRVDVSDVQVTEISGYLGSAQAVLLVRGDFLIATDLSKASILESDPSNRRVSVRLTVPRVMNARLDHERSRLVALQGNGTWKIFRLGEVDTGVVNAAYRDAQDLIAHAAAKAEGVATAKARTTQLLKTFGTSLGWQVEVRWEEDASKDGGNRK